MNTREALYELLTGSPDQQFEVKFQSLLASDSESVLYSTSIIDVLFFWLYKGQKGQPASTNIKEFLSRYLGLHSVTLCPTSSQQSLLKHFIKKLGLKVHGLKNHPHVSDKAQPTDYYAASRAMIAGIDIEEETLSEEDVARDVCFYLYKCDFEGAFNSLQCLRALRPELKGNQQIVEFSKQAGAYLSEVVNIYPSPILLWEKELLENLTLKNSQKLL